MPPVSHELLASATTHETRFRRTTFTPPQNAAPAAYCGLFLLRRLHLVEGIEKAESYSARRDTETLVDLPVLSHHLQVLFSNQWKPLNDQTLSLPELSCPGVYLIGFAPKLAGTRVNIGDVFYVGMSTTSLRTRLRQFLRGVEDDQHHSAAKRFFERWTNRKPFSQVNTPNRFFVTTYSAECEPEKGLRTPGDLQQLGLVTALGRVHTNE